MEHTIEIPADAKTVTLELAGSRALTLRSLLPHIKNWVELIVTDDFGVGVNTDADLYRLKTPCGDSLLRTLMRSRVVDGESILGLTPEVRFANPKPTMVNGTLANLPGTGCIQLCVKLPAPEERS